MLLAIVASVTFASCDGKKKKAEPVETFSKTALTVENLVSADREYIFLNETREYRYYETTVTLKDYLDADTQDGTIESVKNTFYFVDESEGIGKAIHAVHTLDGVEYIPEYGLWVGDEDMSEIAMPVTFNEAYQRLMEANCMKPHSRYCVLRKEIGPVEANPQYIFGNTHYQVYVDAVTGEVSLDNPAYKGFGE